jgi:hypothetical protein
MSNRSPAPTPTTGATTGATTGSAAHEPDPKVRRQTRSRWQQPRPCAALDHAALDAGTGVGSAWRPSARAGRNSVTSASIHSAPWKRATETR